MDNTSSHPFQLSVVLSFKNEQAVIPELLRRLTLAIAPMKIDYELIFVNDASTDQSLNILTAAAQTDRHVRVLNMSRNFGHDQCVLAGIQYASGDGILVMDSDLQDPPELIPKMVTEFQVGVDIVYTTRLSRAGEPRAKLWLASFGYFLLSRASRFVPANTGDFKLFSRRVAREMLKLDEKVPFFRGMVNWVGFKRTQVFYHREARFAGVTNVPVFGGGPIKAFLAGMISFSNAPITLAFTGGVAMTCLALLAAVASYFLNAGQFVGWQMVICTLLLVGGVQLIFLGFLGFYVGAILDQVRNRPGFIVESTLGFENSKAKNPVL